MMELLNYFVVVVLIISLVDCNEWLPKFPNNFEPDFNQFHRYKSEKLATALDKFHSDNFQWMSLSSFSLKSSKTSFIIFGGSRNIKRDSESGYGKDQSIVVLCKLKLSVSDVSLVECNKMNDVALNDSYLLGATVKTYMLPDSDNEGLLVYCDPLWNYRDDKIPKPSGRCYLKCIDSNENVSFLKTIEFCKLSQKSFKSCMAGFSIDLMNTNNRWDGLKMLVGMPSMVPYGGVSYVKNMFRKYDDPIFSTPRYNEGKYYNYGYKVVVSNLGHGYASSPLSDEYGPNVTDVSQANYKFTSPDNVAFSSFGVSMTSLNIDRDRVSAIVIGAPYHTVNNLANVGKVYIFCVSNDQYNLADFRHGTKADEFFGYSLANIGDINGDGNDDIAITSSFFNDSSKGFVSIYTLDKKCNLSKTPTQLIKSTQNVSTSLFGIDIVGKTDIDHNSWPDLLILNSQSKSIDLIVSRSRLKAQCRFKLSPDYTTQPLIKDSTINVKLDIFLKDLRKNSLIDLKTMFKSFKLNSQIKLNMSGYFEVISSTENEIQVTTNYIQDTLELIAQLNAESMDLSEPIIINYRLFENCTSSEQCHDRLFPLIDWSNCYQQIPITKFFCFASKPCSADLTISLVDTLSNQVEYSNKKEYHRSINLTITNNGPTEAKYIRLVITAGSNRHLLIDLIQSDKKIFNNVNKNLTQLNVSFDYFELDSDASISVIITAHFPKDLTDFTDNSLMASVVSGINDTNTTNNHAKLQYNFIYAPNISFAAVSTRDTLIDSRNRTAYIYPGHRVGVDMIGPRLSQICTLDNMGKGDLLNVSVVVSLPVRAIDGSLADVEGLHSSQGLNILYLFDRIRGINNQSELNWLDITPQISLTQGSQRQTLYCTLPANYINPLKLIPFETHASHLMDIDSEQPQSRKKRSMDNENPPEATSITDNDVKLGKDKLNRYLTTIIRCGKSGMDIKSVICVDIICKIPKINPKQRARFQVNAWLWAYTFFKKQISDIMVYSTIKIKFDKPPPGVKLIEPDPVNFAESQRVLFINMKAKITHRYMIWPIIVGLIIGILIMAILIVALYKCGFFKRTKRRRPLSTRMSSSKQRGTHHKPIIVHQYDNPNENST